MNEDALYAIVRLDTILKKIQVETILYLAGDYSKQHYISRVIALQDGPEQRAAQELARKLITEHPEYKAVMKEMQQ